MNEEWKQMNESIKSIIIVTDKTLPIPLSFAYFMFSLNTEIMFHNKEEERKQQPNI